jgi:hypothetical protein
MSNAVAAALIGVGGVVLGVVLTAVIDHRSRQHVSEEQLEQARHARELVAAEALDEALVRASRALVRGSSGEPRWAQAREAYQDGWVEYSPRIRSRELLNRYRAVGTLLTEIVVGDLKGKHGIGRASARAIANARATLAYFMRGDESLPPASFPEPDELMRLLGQGDGQDDPLEPLKEWLNAHPEAQFHTPPQDT